MSEPEFDYLSRLKAERDEAEKKSREELEHEIGQVMEKLRALGQRELALREELERELGLVMQKLRALGIREVALREALAKKGAG